MRAWRLHLTDGILDGLLRDCSASSPHLINDSCVVFVAKVQQFMLIAVGFIGEVLQDERVEAIVEIERHIALRKTHGVIPHPECYLLGNSVVYRIYLFAID